MSYAIGHELVTLLWTLIKPWQSLSEAAWVKRLKNFRFYRNISHKILFKAAHLETVGFGENWQ